MSIVECRKFSFSYGTGAVLKDISFKLEQGEWVTILGPNGSGKSTLLKCLLRLAEAGKSHGEILVRDRPIDSYNQIELARQFAYVPQAGGRVPPFIVEDFVNLSRYPYAWRGGISRTEGFRAVKDALALTNTDIFAKKRLDALSGGQRQLVFLAAALAQETNILLLDEPAAFLDPHHVYIMNNLLKKLHVEKGLTIIIVTHDLNLPFDIGSKALVIREGHQIYFGNALDMTADRVLEHAFAHEFNYLRHPVTDKIIVTI